MLASPWVDKSTNNGNATDQLQKGLVLLATWLSCFIIVSSMPNAKYRSLLVLENRSLNLKLDLSIFCRNIKDVRELSVHHLTLSASCLILSNSFLWSPFQKRYEGRKMSNRIESRALGLLTRGLFFVPCPNFSSKFVVVCCIRLNSKRLVLMVAPPANP